jgi:multicomponent Na+:H+ antiporter subunit B
MIRHALILIAILPLAAIFAFMVADFSAPESLRSLATYYVENVPAELGAPNVVTGILITYRGLDTIGEVAVLFVVAASVGLILGKRSGSGLDAAAELPTPASELVVTGANILLPIILVFGAYLIANGHLSPGGGFQGGAIVASAIMLLLLSRRESTLDHGRLSVTESLAGVLYVCVGLLGLVFAGGFLDSRILPAGDLGAFISAGAIPIVSVLLGVKVSAELSVIIDRFRG